MEDLEKIKGAIHCIETVVHAAEFDGLLSGNEMSACHFIESAEKAELLNKLIDAACTPLFEYDPEGLFPCMYRKQKLVELTKDFEHAMEKITPHLAMVKLDFLGNSASDISIPIMKELCKIKSKLESADEELDIFIHALEQTTPEPAHEPEQADNKIHPTAWLIEVFGNNKGLVNDFLQEVQSKLERKPTQKASALLSTFIRYNPQWYRHKSNAALADQLELCTGVRLTPQNFEHYNDKLDKFPKADK